MMVVVSDIYPDEQLLTVDQAYLAAYQFLRQFYERDSRKPESLFFLLSWMELKHPRMSSDPAQWSDWLKSVEVALARQPHEQFSEPLSPPLTK